MAQRWDSPHGPEEVPGQGQDWSPPQPGGIDPISVAFAALSSGRSETRASQTPDNGENGSGTPLRARFGHLVQRARSVIGSRDDEAEQQAAPTAGGPVEAGPDDPGWVFHRRVGDGRREGWLYHYADGTMVSEDGTVYEYPSHDTDSLAHDPTVEEEGTADGGAVERTGESPTEVSGAHHEAPSQPPADGDTEPAVVAEAAQQAQAPVAGGDTLQSDEEAESEPEQDTDEKSEDQSDEKTDARSEDQSQDQSETRSEEEQQEESRDDESRSEEEESRDDQTSSDGDPSVPEVEGGGGPMAAATDAVAGVWLRDKAKGKQTLETVDIPAFIEYSPTNLLRYVSGGLFALAAIAAVMTIFYAVQAESLPHVILGGVFVLIALVSSWVLLTWEPTVISIREGILEVAKGPHGEQVDLRDPRTEVEVGHNVSSPTWKTTVHRAGAKDLKIRAGQVKARQFAAIVEHYVSHPRQKPRDEDE